MVRGDSVGDTLHTGAGAGSLPTASAIVADIIDLSRAMSNEINYVMPSLGFHLDGIAAEKIMSSEEFVCANYLRIDVFDSAGVMSKLSGVFAELDVSIEAIIQKEPVKGSGSVSVIFLTQETVEARINKAINTIQNFDAVSGKVVRIRLEHLD